jgi:hypothetical protein
VSSPLHPSPAFFCDGIVPMYSRERATTLFVFVADALFFFLMLLLTFRSPPLHGPNVARVFNKSCRSKKKKEENTHQAIYTHTHTHKDHFRGSSLQLAFFHSLY